MALGNLIPSELSFVSIAKQSVQGTGVTGTNVLRATTISPQPNIPYLEDDSFQQSMAKVHGLVTGPTSASFEMDSYLYADEIGWALASLLGDLTVTGSSDPYTTAFSLLNTAPGQTKYYTITDFNGSDATNYVDCKANELSVTYSSDQLATVNSKWDAISNPSTTKPAISVGATLAQPAWAVTFGINSVTGVLVTDTMVDIKRTNSSIPGLGGQSVDAIVNGGDLDVTGSFTQVFDSTNGNTVYGYYKAGTVVPITLNLDTGATPDRQVQFQLTTCNIDKATLGRSTGKYVELACTFHGVANSTDVGTSAGTAPVKATTKAELPTATYA